MFTKENGQPFKTIENSFRSACRRAGLHDVSPHCLRHTFASRLGMANVDLRTIQELGRWGDIRMIQRYANLSMSHKAEAIEKVLGTRSPETVVEMPRREMPRVPSM